MVVGRVAAKADAVIVGVIVVADIVVTIVVIVNVTVPAVDVTVGLLVLLSWLV